MQAYMAYMECLGNGHWECIGKRAQLRRSKPQTFDSAPAMDLVPLPCNHVRLFCECTCFVGEAGNVHQI